MLWLKRHVSYGQFGSINWCNLSLARGAPPSSVNKQEEGALKIMIKTPCVLWSIWFSQLMKPKPCAQSTPFQCQQTRTCGTESYDQNTMCPMVNLVQSKCTLSLACGVPPSSVKKLEQMALKVMIKTPCVLWSIWFNQLMKPKPCTRSAPFQCQQTRRICTEDYDQNTMCHMVNLVQSTDET
jgi:hypothetical protein